MSEYLLPACAGSVACVILLVMILRREYRPKTVKVSRRKGDMTGLKILVWSEAHKCWRSPTYPGLWINGCIQSDQPPAEDNQHGIHVGKNIKAVAGYLGTPGAKLFLVGMREPIVEQEKGYRAAAAYIIEEAPVDRLW